MGHSKENEFDTEFYGPPAGSDLNFGVDEYDPYYAPEGSDLNFGFEDYGAEPVYDPGFGMEEYGPEPVMRSANGMEEFESSELAMETDSPKKGKRSKGKNLRSSKKGKTERAPKASKKLKNLMGAYHEKNGESDKS